MIRIRSKREGFRRAGLAHSVASREYPDDFFSREQLAALKAEPMLTIEETGSVDPDSGKSALVAEHEKMLAELKAAFEGGAFTEPEAVGDGDAAPVETKKTKKGKK